MRERAAQETALVRAFEEADAAGLLLSARERSSATAGARVLGGSEEGQAGERARLLLARLEVVVPGLGRVRRCTRLAPALLVPVAVVALALGIATNALGPQRHLSLLAFPLLGLLAWNLVFYPVSCVLFLRRLRDVRPGATGTDTPAPLPGGGRLFAWLGEWAFARAGGPDPDRAAVAARALAQYGQVWGEAAAPLMQVRLRMLMHLGAAMMVLGAILGMYLRGLSFAYEATWESTFLSAERVATLLHLVLGPTAALLDSTLPDAAGLGAMRAPEGGVPAAIWIHMWALTAGALVIVPRLLLAGLAGLIARQRAQAVPISPLAGSFRALAGEDRGKGVRVDIFPYSYAMPAREADAALAFAHEVVGRAAVVRISPVVDYGAGTPMVPDSERAACILVVFALVQSPELEVHGDFLRHLQATVPEARLLAVVDRSPWRLRFGTTEDERAGERQRAWDRVVREVGLTATHLDLGTEIQLDTMALAGEASQGSMRQSQMRKS
ncbi:MAG: DUF2868 domain-containing protein [Deltaproteobacteria bacterium]